MKRFHVHVTVDKLASSIVFYSKLFGQAPARQRDDYAKWMLDDPRLNFAISTRGHAVGVNHFGFQVDSAEELETLRQLAESVAGEEIREQGAAACCYARSEKHWVIDPQGLAWEHFHTLSDIQEFGMDTAQQTDACGVPVRSSTQNQEQAKRACCIPGGGWATGDACC